MGAHNPLEDVAVEVHNPHKELAVIFTTRHPDMVLQPFHWHRRRCEPGGQVQLPHMAYTVLFEDGTEVPPLFLVTKFGKAIGKGITTPSQVLELTRGDQTD